MPNFYSTCFPDCCPIISVEPIKHYSSNILNGDYSFFEEKKTHLILGIFSDIFRLYSFWGRLICKKNSFGSTFLYFIEIYIDEVVNDKLMTPEELVL